MVGEEMGYILGIMRKGMPIDDARTTGRLVTTGLLYIMHGGSMAYIYISTSIDGQRHWCIYHTYMHSIRIQNI